jgi:hypothetical protein
MPTNPSIEYGVFEPEATAAMGEAFEAACKELRDVGQLQMVRKVVARRIIASARGGELDPVRLRTVALSGLLVAETSPGIPLISYVRVSDAASH